MNKNWDLHVKYFQLIFIKRFLLKIFVYFEFVINKIFDMGLESTTDKKKLRYKNKNHFTIINYEY